MKKLIFLCTFLLIQSAQAQTNLQLLGRGWQQENGGQWVAAVCENQGCSSFSFQLGNLSSHVQIGPSFPLPAIQSEQDRKEYLQILFESLYRSETEEEKDILFNFETQSFNLMSSATDNQQGWNWGVHPLFLDNDQFQSLVNRISEKGEFWYKIGPHCRNIRKLIQISKNIGLELKDFPVFNNLSKFYQSNCVKVKKVKEKSESTDSEQRFLDNLSHDDF